MKFKIVGVNLGVDGNNNDYLRSLKCEDLNGKCFKVDPLSVELFLGFDDLDQHGQIDWSREQIVTGKVYTL